MSHPLVGAWEIHGEALHALAVFTAKHYTFLVMDAHRKPFQREPPTQAEQAEAFVSFGAFGGTYAVSGNTMTIHRDLARDPGTVGVDYEWEYDVDGDQLRIKVRSGRRGVSRTPRPEEWVLRKVS
jgi:hypothetical protein